MNWLSVGKVINYSQPESLHGTHNLAHDLCCFEKILQTHNPTDATFKSQVKQASQVSKINHSTQKLLLNFVSYMRHPCDTCHQVYLAMIACMLGAKRGWPCVCARVSPPHNTAAISAQSINCSELNSAATSDSMNGRQ